MTLRKTNLNLLPVLQALLAEASITRAATVLGLSQPATSHALGRLRDVFNDPLLVPVGRSMRLTPRGEELRARIDTVCAGIEDLLLDRVFDPGRLNRDFTIATADYMSVLLGPALIRAVAETAPGVTVRLTDAGPGFPAPLASGDVDVAIVAYLTDMARGFHVMRGYMDRLVGVVSRDHPLATRSAVTEADLAVYPRLGIDPGLHGPIAAHASLTYIVSSGTPLKLSASQLLALPLLIPQTQAVAIMPGTLAEHAARLVPITCFELPNPAPLDVCIMWSPIHDVDPAQRWFRSILDTVMREQFGAPIS